MVIVVAAGLGGGLMIANTMNTKTPAVQATKLERRAAEPSQAPSPSPSPHPGTTQAAMTPAIKGTSAQAGQGAKAQSSAATATNAPAAGEPSPAPSQAAPGEAHEKSGTTDAAFAKAGDADLKTPEADNKRSAERRHSRHHRQWAERRRMQYQPAAAPPDMEQASRDGDVRSYRDDSNPRTDPDDGAARIYRDASRARGYPDEGSFRRDQDGSARDRDYAAEPVELALPRIRLFDGF